jgi:hypothetical protein
LPAPWARFEPLAGSPAGSKARARVATHAAYENHLPMGVHSRLAFCPIRSLLLAPFEPPAATPSAPIGTPSSIAVGRESATIAFSRNTDFRPGRTRATRWTMIWNHHTTAGAFRLAKVALRVLQEKGALNLSPEALAREVVDVVLPKPMALRPSS